jgi:hypothetical protein
LKATKLTVMKGLTVEKPHPSGDKWRKTGITIEVELNDGDTLEGAKSQLDKLIDGWLKTEG